MIALLLFVQLAILFVLNSDCDCDCSTESKSAIRPIVSEEITYKNTFAKLVKELVEEPIAEEVVAAVPVAEEPVITELLVNTRFFMFDNNSSILNEKNNSSISNENYITINIKNNEYIFHIPTY